MCVYVYKYVDSKLMDLYIYTYIRTYEHRERKRRQELETHSPACCRTRIVAALVK